MERMDFSERVKMMDGLLGDGRCFDMTSRMLQIAGRQAKLWVVNGFADDAVLERMVSVWLSITDWEGIRTLEDFLARYVSIADVTVEQDRDKAATAVFAGKTLLMIDGFAGGIMLDAKQFPLRGVEEPDASRVLRGSHDGFGESLMINAALLRRRIRHSALTMEIHQVGGRTGLDTAICYMAGEADEKLVEELRQKLAAMDIRSASMGQESVTECLSPRQWYNPFPKVRYTERPDVAAACLMEGNVLLMIDNSASALILPTTIWSFAEEINDYYFPPIIGSYLRILRLIVLTLTLFVTPMWYLLVNDPAHLPAALHFLLVEEDFAVPLIVQLLLVEFIIDILKLASLNTPNSLSNSFSMLGALILGDFAVQSRWLVPEVLVYMAFVAVANYAQHSYEMGYAFKLCRFMLLILIWLAGWWGFGLGVVIILVLIATTKPLVGRGYLYPLIPFNGRALRAILHRRPISRENT
ncbi:MAG: spore germination protein [Oscillospiraceae bacterium]|nr:spore germination protein [Oscillospiraceae bacterium]